MARKNLLKGFKRPGAVTCDHAVSTSDYGKFVAYPFERGFGTTVGNTLRRVLLSSIQGYAVTAIRFTTFGGDGQSEPHLVTSEYEPLPGVREDISDIIAAIKKLQISMPEESEGTVITLSCKGPGVITGKDFERNQIEITNPDLPIFTMMDDCNLEMEVQIDLGRGYVPSELSDKYTEELGTISIDAFYSPVKRVKYSIEPTRVGQRNDYEKLTLEVWTDGTITPDNALGEAAKIIKEHFTMKLMKKKQGSGICSILLLRNLSSLSALRTASRMPASGQSEIWQERLRMKSPRQGISERSLFLRSRRSSENGVSHLA